MGIKVDRIAEVVKEQNAYVASLGGYKELLEADEIYNGYNLKILMEYNVRHPDSVIGYINTKGNGIYEPLCDENVYKCWGCDFVIRKPDDELKRLIEEYRASKYRPGMIEAIFEKIADLDGAVFIWT